jgi:putative NIF3 family GTP cyclohydrolase 1 type 2
MKAGAVMAKLKSELRAPEADPPYEGLVAGTVEVDVTGILTCAMPSVDVLHQARKASCNLILCDGHPFFLYDSGWASQQGLAQSLDRSPVTTAKRALITEAGLAVLRFPTAWKTRFPQACPFAFARALGLTPEAPGASADFAVADIRHTSFETLALQCAQAGKIDAVRLVGDGRLPVRRVAIANGLVSPAKLRRMIVDPTVDAVIAGEVNEWEGGPYLQDVIATGRAMAMMLCGFAASQASLAGLMGDWVQSVLPEMRVARAAQRTDIWTNAHGVRQ